MATKPKFSLTASPTFKAKVMSGATGLDYNVVYRKMDRLSLAPAEYDALERDIQIMESAALACMHQKT
ncbi:DUF1799 domain-containing protein [Janthinobacterium sp. HLS12-2]|uniref:DUF1799 domain-containing protein n=1 Tax=Janthinobacterium sp. HLS12-2 TaxID=1259324 RepID=UPI003F29C121